MHLLILDDDEAICTFVADVATGAAGRLIRLGAKLTSVRTCSAGFPMQ